MSKGKLRISFRTTDFMAKLRSSRYTFSSRGRLSSVLSPSFAPGSTRTKSSTSDFAVNVASPHFFPALSLTLFFTRAPLSERLKQATVNEARGP